MIVLDEQLLDPRLERAIAAWYRGPVVNVVDLLPGRAIRDEAIPAILRTVRRPTFVTVNVSDLWNRVPADTHYCVVCFALLQGRRHAISPMLRNLLALDEFDTKSKRMGKVVLATEKQIRYYQFPAIGIREVPWMAG